MIVACNESRHRTCATVGMKVFLYHASSFSTAAASLPLIVACAISGYMEAGDDDADQRWTDEERK
jgi:hypothetical protein